MSCNGLDMRSGVRRKAVNWCIFLSVSGQMGAAKLPPGTRSWQSALWKKLRQKMSELQELQRQTDLHERELQTQQHADVVVVLKPALLGMLKKLPSPRGLQCKEVVLQQMQKGNCLWMPPKRRRPHPQSAPPQQPSRLQSYPPPPLLPLPRGQPLMKLKLHSMLQLQQCMQHTEAQHTDMNPLCLCPAPRGRKPT